MGPLKSVARNEIRAYELTMPSNPVSRASGAFGEGRPGRVEL